LRDASTLLFVCGERGCRLVHETVRLKAQRFAFEAV
jgi:hypothetical protein